MKRKIDTRRTIYDDYKGLGKVKEGGFVEVTEDECEEDEEYIPKSITKDYIKQQEKKNGNNR